MPATALRWSLHDEKPSQRTSESVNTAHPSGAESPLALAGRTYGTKHERWFERLLNDGQVAHDEPSSPDVIRAIDHDRLPRSAVQATSPSQSVDASSSDSHLRVTRRYVHRVESRRSGDCAAIAREHSQYDLANAHYQDGALRSFSELDHCPADLPTARRLGQCTRSAKAYIDQTKCSLCRSRSRSAEHASKLVHTRGQTLAELTGVAHARGDLATARAWADETLAFSRSINRNWAIANALNKLGQAALAQGDDLVATAAWCEVPSDSTHKAMSASFSAALKDWHTLPVRNQHDQATPLLGAASTIRAAIGTPLPPVDQPSMRETLSTLRLSLGDEAFNKLYADGADMTLDEAVVYSLQTADA